MPRTESQDLDFLNMHHLLSSCFPHSNSCVYSNDTWACGGLMQMIELCLLQRIFAWFLQSLHGFGPDCCNAKFPRAF